MAARPLSSIPQRLFSLSRPFPRNALWNIVSITPPTSQPDRPLRSIRPTPPETLAQKIGKSVWLPGAISKVRVHSDVNVARPKEYWDYETLTVQWGEHDEYEVVRKVGRGKYNEVFEGVHSPDNECCIIKILKPVKME